jgi:hypothetical protein
VDLVIHLTYPSAVQVERSGFAEGTPESVTAIGVTRGGGSGGDQGQFMKTIAQAAFVLSPPGEPLLGTPPVEDKMVSWIPHALTSDPSSGWNRVPVVPAQRG